MNETVDSIMHRFMFPYGRKAYENRLLWLTDHKQYTAFECIQPFLSVINETAVTEWCAYLGIRIDMYRPGDIETGRQRKSKRIVARNLLRCAENNPEVMRVLDFIYLWANRRNAHAL
jgi:hypothetical protein